MNKIDLLLKDLTEYFFYYKDTSDINDNKIKEFKQSLLTLLTEEIDKCKKDEIKMWTGHTQNLINRYTEEINKAINKLFEGETNGK